MKIRMFLKIIGLTALFASVLAYSPKNFAKSRLKKKEFKELKSLEILVKTNVPGFSFQGYLKDSVPIRKGRLVIPHKRLTTEMDLRDKHMYKKIFQKQNVKFAGIAKCYKNIKCKVVGKLDIAGKQKKIKFIIRKSGKYFQFTHKLKLTDYNIEIPEFTGVKVKNEIVITGRIR